MIKLDTFAKVKEFVDIANRFEGNIELSSKRFIANAKSIMDVCSLDLKNELTLVVRSEKDFLAIIEEVEPYMVV